MKDYLVFLTVTILVHFKQKLTDVSNGAVSFVDATKKVEKDICHQTYSTNKDDAEGSAHRMAMICDTDILWIKTELVKEKTTIENPMQAALRVASEKGLTLISEAA